ncbi:MAG: hypothetical protein IT269_11935, partial [Saprospiraceae bacterium]|nr:hypothetical protein [Saprospiraceae bacterium]
MKHQAILMIAMMLICAVFSQAQSPVKVRQSASNPWKVIRSHVATKPTTEAVVMPSRFNLLELDFEQFKTGFQPLVLQRLSNSDDISAIIDVPTPNGEFQQFRVVYDPVMHPDLAAKFPEIRSFSGVGVDNPSAKIFCDISPLGFHALVLTTGQSAYLIETVTRFDVQHYYCYEQRFGGFS